MRKCFKKVTAIVLTIALTVSLLPMQNEKNIVKAESTEENTNSYSRELVQCSDDWVIFKYINDEGVPQFDITYQGKELEEIEEEGDLLDYRVIAANQYASPDDFAWWRNFDNSKLKYDIYDSSSDAWLIQFKYVDCVAYDEASDEYEYEDLSRSEVLFLYDNGDGSYEKTPHIISMNVDYYEIYDMTPVTNKPHKFNLKIKVDEQLIQEGDLAAKIDSYASDEILSYIEEHPITNISFENYEEYHEIDGESYEMKYSIVSLDIDLFPEWVETKVYGAYMDCYYSIVINGIKGMESNTTISEIPLYARTPRKDYVYIESIKINAPSTIKVGEPVQLTVTILPDNATDKDQINWFCYYEEGTIDDNGLLVANESAIGKTIIVDVDTPRGNPRASCRIQVVADVTQDNQNDDKDTNTTRSSVDNGNEKVTTKNDVNNDGQNVTTESDTDDEEKKVTTENGASDNGKNVTTKAEVINIKSPINEVNTTIVSKEVEKPKQVKIKKIKRKAKSITVNIGKIKRANGYQVKYGTNKKVTKNAKTKLIKKTSFVIKKLKATKKYYIKVRAYVLDGNKKVYGKWSKVKVVKKFK